MMIHCISATYSQTLSVLTVFSECLARTVPQFYMKSLLVYACTSDRIPGGPLFLWGDRYFVQVITENRLRLRDKERTFTDACVPSKDWSAQS